MKRLLVALSIILTSCGSDHETLNEIEYFFYPDNRPDGEIDEYSPNNEAPVQQKNLGLAFHSAGIEKPLEFLIDDSFSSAQILAIQKAAQHWNFAAGRDIIVVGNTFTKTKNQQESFYEFLNDDQSYIVNKFNWKVTGKPSSVLGTTIWTHSEVGSQLVSQASIFANASSYHFTDTSRNPYTKPSHQSNGVVRSSHEAVDMYSLMLHEFGHAIGLSHTSADSVMIPKLVTGYGSHKRVLKMSDVKAVSTLYQNKENSSNIYSTYLQQNFVKFANSSN